MNTQNPPAMRAKLQIDAVVPNKDENGTVLNEQLHFHGVCASQYPEDGSDENNTFAKFSPSVSLDITIANPALIGKFQPGQVFYVDFTDATLPVSMASVEEVPISEVPDFKQACNFLRADILAIDKQVVALRGHDRITEIPAKDGGEVLSNLTIAHRKLEDARMRLGNAIQHSESRESIFDIKQDPEARGKLAFERWNKSMGVAPFGGWEDLDPQQRRAWIAAGSVGEPIAQ